MFTINDYRESADYIRGLLNGFQPDVLFILGSGLGALGDEVESPIFIPYSDIPHFKKSTALGHKGRFVAGILGGKRVLVMQGRLHVYEGHTAEEVAYPVRVAKLLGVGSMIVTNAAGGVDTDYKAGELMIIKDYIKFNIPNPLIGPNIDEFGERFPDMSHTFDPEYMRLFRFIVSECGERIHEGNYFYMSGPQYETPAEIRAIRILGGNAVGMSTVPECIAANHAKMRILGVTLITNMAAGVLDKPLSGQEVIDAGNAASGRFKKYMKRFLERMES